MTSLECASSTKDSIDEKFTWNRMEYHTSLKQSSEGRKGGSPIGEKINFFPQSLDVRAKKFISLKNFCIPPPNVENLGNFRVCERKSISVPKVLGNPLPKMVMDPPLVQRYGSLEARVLWGVRTLFSRSKSSLIILEGIEFFFYFWPLKIWNSYIFSLPVALFNPLPPLLPFTRSKSPVIKNYIFPFQAIARREQRIFNHFWIKF